MKIQDLKPRDAIGVDASETLRGAAKHLADDDIGVLVVWSARGATGIFSERDLTRAIADDVDLDDGRVDEYMTESPVAVGLDADLDEAIAKMNEHGMRHVVVSDGPDICGVVSMRDVIAALEELPAPLPSSR